MTDGTVTVLGSLHYDITVEGPALPRRGETIAGSSWRPKLGGKGRNQAVAAARAGVRVSMIGAVGDDHFGRELLADLDARGIDRRCVRVVGAASGMSVAIFDGEGDYGAVIVSGANLQLGEGDVAAAAALWPDTRVLILQNEVPERANIAAAAAMRAAGGTVILNAAPVRPLAEPLVRLVDLLVVNAVESATLCAIAEPATLSEAAAAAARLTQQFSAAIVTAGGAGVAFADRARQLSIPARAVEVESTHGAGDEFVGRLGALLAHSEALDEALAMANEAAGRLVATPEALRD